MIKKTRSYSGIDAFRLLAAFCIVGVHVSYADLNNLVVLLLHRFGGFAVPFFFMVSGFFWKIDTPSKLRSQVIKLLSIIIVANAVYVIVDTLSGTPWTALLELQSLITGVAGHLWFLNALLLGSVFMYYVGFRINQRLMAVIALLIYAGYCLLITYKVLEDTAFNSSFYRTFLVIPFMFLGYQIRSSETKLRAWPVWSVALLVAGGFLLLCAESFLMYRWGWAISPHAMEFNFGLLVFVLGMLLWALRSDPPEQYVRLGRDHSLFIYLYHPVIIVLYARLVEMLLPQNIRHYAYWCSGIAVFVITLAISLLLSKLAPPLSGILNGKWKQRNLPAGPSLPQEKM